MNLSVEILTKQEWSKFEDKSHADLFGESFVDLYKDYSYALVVVNETNEKCGYATVQEIDSRTAFINFGGVFSKFKNSHIVYPGFSKIISWLKDDYQYVGFSCSTKNKPMIKFGLKQDFEIIGMRLFRGGPILEFMYERGL